MRSKVVVDLQPLFRLLKRMKELEDENNRLKKMFADMALKNRAIKDLLGKL